jgi:hypothetical protein
MGIGGQFKVVMNGRKKVIISEAPQLMGLVIGRLFQAAVRRLTQMARIMVQD